MGFSLHDVHALVLGDEEVERLIWILDGADLVLVVDKVAVNR